MSMPRRTVATASPYGTDSRAHLWLARSVPTGATVAVLTHQAQLWLSQWPILANR
jgi:hypothetical protein